MTTTKIKTIKAEIASLLSADVELTTTLETHIYGSRQLPGRFDRELCVFSYGNVPAQTAVLGGGGDSTGRPVYQYAILWLVQFEIGELAAAEDVENDIENAVYRVLLTENRKHSLWNTLSFPQFSIHPPSPGGTEQAHFGRTIVRVLAKD